MDEIIRQTCRECGVYKTLENFSRNWANTSKHSYCCKQCELARHRSYDGKLLGMYRSQHATSKKRKHAPPNYTLEEFKKWAEAQGYRQLYEAWVNSGYEWRTAPSADRLDNDVSYQIDNLQLITFQENEAKAHRQLKTGELVNNHTPVNQLTKCGRLIKTHLSQAMAARELNISQGNISRALKPESNCTTAGGFRWEFAQKNKTL